MPEQWDKDNPPEEFWGSSGTIGRKLLWLAVAFPYLFGATVAVLSLMFIGVILTVDRVAVLSPLFSISILSVSCIFIHIIARCLGSAHSLYYHVYDDTFKVRVDVTGPILIRAVIRRRPLKKVFRFTEKDVQTLSLSGQLLELSGMEVLTPVVRLNFLLQDGNEFRHDHYLTAGRGGGGDADHGRFLELLDRLEAILGRDRMEGFVTAREAVERAAKRQVGSKESVSSQ